MAGSVRVAVKAALIEGLADLFASLPGFNSDENQVQVEYGYTTGEVRAAQRVYCGRSYSDTPPAAMKSGRNHRQETGYLDLIVLAEVPGGSAQDADERVDAIGTEIETWIADRKQGDGLGVTGLYELLVDRMEADYYPSDGGNAAIKTITVLWRSRLT